MKIGIIGLPNVGKSSLFNLLTQAHVQVANFPFTTIDRNIGMAMLPDERLVQIHTITQSPKVTCAQIEFIDIAGLIKGASKGDGLGNTFLSHIRDVDMLLHVLRCFDVPEVPHTYAYVSPLRDHEVVRAELFLADLEMIERRIEKTHKKIECREELILLQNIRESLMRGEVPKVLLADVPIITTKKEIAVLNLDENKGFDQNIPGYKVSIKMEEDIQDMTDAEKKELRQEIGANPEGLAGLLAQCLEKLSLITFYTIKGEETRAWLIPAGTSVYDAADKIHSDIKNGFIKAEVLPYADFITESGFSNAQHNGKTRIEGKEYIVRDGDIILIKFRT